MQEKQVEKHLIKRARDIGGRTYKFTSPGNNGVPDRIVLYQGHCYFVELKRPGEKLRPIQKAVCREFNRLGFPVHVLDNIEAVEEFVNEIHTT